MGYGPAGETTYVGPLFDGKIPVVEEGDGFVFTVVVDGETRYEWQAGDPPLTESEIAEVWQILETSGIYKTDGTDSTAVSGEIQTDVQAMGNWLFGFHGGVTAGSRSQLGFPAYRRARIR